MQLFLQDVTSFQAWVITQELEELIRPLQLLDLYLYIWI